MTEEKAPPDPVRVLAGELVVAIASFTAAAAISRLADATDEARHQRAEAEGVSLVGLFAQFADAIVDRARSSQT